MHDPNVNPSLRRCPWATTALSIEYHDTQWGMPLRDDRALFELLCLEGAQAGLSWETILKKRDRYRVVFDGFDPKKIVQYDEQKTQKLLADPGIVRNRLKIASVIQNARATLALENEFDGLSDYLWQFVGDQPIRNQWQSIQDVPSVTDESRAMSRDLLKRGFKFVGPTICYALMQAAGLVNDHLTDCYRYDACRDPKLDR